MSVSHVNDDEFEAKIVNAEGSILVDFWAEWCAPCKQIAPALEELAHEYEGKLKIVKINIDDNPRAPTTYGVRSIPTMILFQDGTASATKIGAVPKSQIKTWIDENI